MLRRVAALRPPLEKCTRRVRHERATQWQDADGMRGIDSTLVSARVIGEEMYEPAAAVLDATEVEKAATDTGAVLP